MSRNKDARTPEEKSLRSPVGSKRERQEGQDQQPLGHTGAPGGQPEALSGAHYLVWGIWGPEGHTEPEAPAST